MGRHQMAASTSARARVALGALPLVATVGAIGVGSVVMSPTAAEAPLERPGGGVGGLGPAAPLPFVPALPGAPVTVLDLASTGGPVAADPIVPGRTVGAASPGRGDAEAAPRRTARAGAAGGGGTVARATAARDADAPARGGSGGGGGSVDRDDSGGGSAGSGGSSGSGGSGGSGSSGGSGDSGGSGGRGGGLVGGLLGGVGQTVSGATSVLSFGESSPSLLSFDA
ncbi:hypothetical protein ACQPX6_03725 [Actinomycetospora sp. CA-101289]|uniref:hypothetical protein n=1 Tax=Actinomycetospora sp. CA-101289 TaxID=3239893 RepID=UPI003D955E5C